MPDLPDRFIFKLGNLYLIWQETHRGKCNVNYIRKLWCAELKIQFLWQFQGKQNSQLQIPNDYLETRSSVSYKTVQNVILNYLLHFVKYSIVQFRIRGRILNDFDKHRRAEQIPGIRVTSTSKNDIFVFLYCFSHSFLTCRSIVFNII